MAETLSLDVKDLDLAKREATKIVSDLVDRDFDVNQLCSVLNYAGELVLAYANSLGAAEMIKNEGVPH